MTEEQVRQWRQSRDIARLITDPEKQKAALQKVYDDRDDMMMHCIQRQADRIKKGLANDERFDTELKGVKNNLAEMKEELKPLKETDKDYRGWKLKIQGGVILWRIIRYLVAAGFGGVVVKFATA